jgi:hypothetical protein
MTIPILARVVVSGAARTPMGVGGDIRIEHVREP